MKDQYERRSEETAVFVFETDGARRRGYNKESNNASKDEYLSHGIQRTLMNPGVQQIIGWGCVAIGAIIGVYGGMLVKDAREVLRSTKESAPNNIKELQIRIGVVRLMDDFEADLEKMVEAHSNGIDRIAQEMNYRNLYSSGPHIAAQFALANKHREEVSGKWISFTRKIQDVLLVNGEVELQGDELKTRYAEIRQRTENTLKKIASLTVEYFRKRGATFPSQQIDAAEKELLKPVSMR